MAAALLVATLAACHPSPDVPPGNTSSPTVDTSSPEPPSTTPTPSPTLAPSPSPEVVSAEVRDALGRTTTVTVPGASGAPQVSLIDDVVVVTADLPDDAPLRVHVDGARWKAFSDGSATLTDDDDLAVGGTRPSARNAHGTRRTTTQTDDGGAQLVVGVVPAPSPADTEPAAASTTSTASTMQPAPTLTTVTLTIAPRALVSATWADNVEGGRSLQVDPTEFGRSGTAAALDAVRAELTAAEPEAATTVMDHQLRCHALGAPDKPTWNLEPWRPDVGYLEYLLARCNPT